MAESQSTQTATPAQRIALIKSIVGHATGREVAALDKVRRVIEGATLDDLAAEAVR